MAGQPRRRSARPRAPRPASLVTWHLIQHRLGGSTDEIALVELDTLLAEAKSGLREDHIESRPGLQGSRRRAHLHPGHVAEQVPIRVDERSGSVPVLQSHNALPTQAGDLLGLADAVPLWALRPSGQARSGKNHRADRQKETDHRVIGTLLPEIANPRRLSHQKRTP